MTVLIVETRRATRKKPSFCKPAPSIQLHFPEGGGGAYRYLQIRTTSKLSFGSCPYRGICIVAVLIFHSTPAVLPRQDNKANRKTNFLGRWLQSFSIMEELPRTSLVYCRGKVACPKPYTGHAYTRVVWIALMDQNFEQGGEAPGTPSSYREVLLKFKYSLKLASRIT